MGRGWQDRRDSKEDLTASPIPGASPPASPADSSADHALEIPQAARLPDSLLDKKSESGTGFHAGSGRRQFVRPATASRRMSTAAHSATAPYTTERSGLARHVRNTQSVISPTHCHRAAAWRYEYSDHPERPGANVLDVGDVGAGAGVGAEIGVVAADVAVMIVLMTPL